jgi:regulator of RNase E activity RraA
VPVDVGGVTVNPGDIIIADEDGVVAVPAALLPGVLEKLQLIFEIEEAMGKAIGGDAPVAEIKAIIAKKRPKK